MFSRFSLLLLILTLTHGVNTQTVTSEPTTNTTTIPPTTNITTSPPGDLPTSTPTPTISPNTTTSPNTTISPNTTAAPNITASPPTTPIPTSLCPALNATSNQKLKIIDPQGDQTPPPSSSVIALPNDTRITVTCDTGYSMSNSAIAIKCNGTHWLTLDDDAKIWEPNATPCLATATIPPQKVCPPFSKLEQQTAKLFDGSIIDNGKYPIDTVIITTCAPGYRKTTEDSVIVMCVQQQDGSIKWNGTGIQTCFDIHCPTVTPPSHGRFERPLPSELHVNTSIRIICDPGYHVIRGAGDVDDIITCIGKTGDASWDQATPTCEADVIINNNNNTFIDRNLTGTKEVTNDNKAKNVAGGVIGGILGLAIIIICIYCLCAQHSRTGRWMNLGGTEPKHDGEELQSMNNQMRGSADDDV